MKHSTYGYVGLMFIVSILLLMACGISQILPPPQADELTILGGPEVQGMEIILDGLHIGNVPHTVMVIENYPNYLQVGPWRMIFIPPMTMDTLYLGQSPNHEKLMYECIGTAEVRIE